MKLMGDKKNEISVLVTKPERKRPIGRNMCRACANTVEEFLVPQKAGIS